MKKGKLFMVKSSQISSVEFDLKSPSITLNIQGRLVNVFFYEIEKAPEDTWYKKLRNKVSIIERAWNYDWDEKVVFRNVEVEDAAHISFWCGEQWAGDRILQSLDEIVNGINRLK